MNAIIISIGDELVLGQSVDTNAAWLSNQLRLAGINTFCHNTVPDDEDAIVHAIRQAAQSAAVVLITGGLGPTDDDLTRQAIGKAIDSPLQLHQGSLDEIQGFFNNLGRSMPEINKVQAMIPTSAEPISNNCGTAPGVKAKLHNATIYAMPGVPREMMAMFQDKIRPQLNISTNNRKIILTTELHSLGMGESTVGELLNELMARDRNPTVGTTASDGLISIRIRCRMQDSEKANDAMNSTVREIKDRLGDIIFGQDQTTLAEAVIELLLNQNLTLTTAESCTGGLISKLITDVPGSSNVFAGGWVTYANRAKIDQLGVPPRIIYSHGSVSEPVVREMARSALNKNCTELAIATSGIAGPAGGSAEKPVGTVWFALAYKDKFADSVKTRTMLTQLAGDRESVRNRAAYTALQMLRLHILNKPLSLIQFANTINEQ